MSGNDVYCNDAAAYSAENSGGDDFFSGGFDTDKFVENNKGLVFWTAIIAVFIVIIMLILVATKVLHTGTGSSFTNKSHLNSGWWMQSGDSGYGGPLAGKGNDYSLRFGEGMAANKDNAVARRQPRAPPHILPNQPISHMAGCPFANNNNGISHMANCPLSRKSHMANCPLANKSNFGPQSMYGSINPNYQTNAQQHFNPHKSNMDVATVDTTTCGDPWDPYATEEAKVLSSVGSYQSYTPGMAAFQRTINNGTVLSDEDLAAVMQGGSPDNTTPANATNPVASQFISHYQPVGLSTNGLQKTNSNVAYY
jgi:hypothetical protein